MKHILIFLAGLVMASPLHAQRLTDLAEATSAADSDYVLIFTGSQNAKKVLLSEIRKVTAAQVSGTAVVTSGSYSDPTWITGLAWTKINGKPTTLLGYGITDAATSAQGSTADATAARLAGSGTLTVNGTGTIPASSAAFSASTAFATSAQGSTADATAARIAGTGTLTVNGTGTIPASSAAFSASTAFATSAQGSTADATAARIAGTGTLTVNGTGTIPASSAAFSASTAFASPQILHDSNFVFEGDSLTAGYGVSAGEDWPSQIMTLAAFSGQGTKVNVATNGATVATITSDYATQVYPYRPAATGKPAYLFVMIGTNDIFNVIPNGTYASMAAYITAWESYISTATADGFKVVAFTILPKTVGVEEPNRFAFNAAIRSNFNIWRLINLADVFPYPIQEPALWNADQIHLSALGYNQMARYTENALLAGGDLRRLKRSPWMTEGNGALGLGNPVPQAALDIGDPFGGAFSLVMGGTGTSIAKTVRVGMRSYIPSNVPVMIFSANTSGDLTLGGGSGSGNAFQQINMYFAATQTSGAGTGAFRFNGTGVKMGGVTNPDVRADIDGGLAIRSSGTIVNLTADDQTVAVGNRSYIRLSSNDSTSTNRTFKLAQSTVNGQVLVLEWTGTFAGELVDDSAQGTSGTHRLSTTWTPTANGTLSLISSGTDWTETGRSSN